VKVVVAAVVSIVSVCAQQATLDANRTVFNVLTAINAAGYDAEIDSPNNSPVRAAVRKEIAARNLETVAELKRFFAQHRRRDWTEELSQYISFALAVDGTNQYQWRFRTEEIPPDAQALEGFGALMTRFHGEAKLDELWQKVEPTYNHALERYHEPVTLTLQQVSAYLRVPSSGQMGRKFHVFIELMGAPHHIQARSYADDYFVVVTPSPELRVEEIRQAYLGFVLDPLATKYSEKIEKKKPLIDLAQPAPLLPGLYKEDFLLLTTKSLVRAVEARLAPASRCDAMVKQALGEGYILSPYFFETLQLYEKQEAAMRLYYPEMIDAIDLRKEDKRLASVEFLSTPVVKTVKTPVAFPPEPTGAAKVLVDAEDLYTARKLPESREKFLSVLNETKEKPLQAKAYYGLARIAALERNPELSQNLFRQVLESEPEPAVRAWAHVYLGRLAGLAQENEEAAGQFEDALKVEGATSAARDAAQKALEQLRKARP